MAAPVDVLLRNPTEMVENWNEQAERWLELNNQIRGHPEFFPLTIKGAYVIGIIHQLCESVSLLLANPEKINKTYIPAYGIFASGIELLGRCVRGNQNPHGSSADLRCGFRWLRDSNWAEVNIDNPLITTPTNGNNYTIRMLESMRHFAAHGQAAIQEANGVHQFSQVDGEILNVLSPLLANSLGRYWGILMESEEYCNNLARANVVPFRGMPILESWILFERDENGKYSSVEEIFNRFDWAIA